jgi:V/A-type H+-transporting ATPase subunit K
MGTYALLIVVLGIILLFVATRHLAPRARIRSLTGLLLVFNGVVAALGLAVAFTAWQPSPALAAAQEPAAVLQSQQAGPTQQGTGSSTASSVALGAALATGLAAIGAGIAVGISGSAAIGAITEKPEVLGRTLIFVGLAEGIAIYGLIISFMILTGAFG